MNVTAEDGFLGLYDHKSSYQHRFCSRWLWHWGASINSHRHIPVNSVYKSWSLLYAAWKFVSVTVWSVT